MNRRKKLTNNKSKKSSVTETTTRSFAQQISTLCDRSIITSVYAVAFLTPFLFTWITSELFEFNKILFVYAIAILAVGSLVVKMILHKKWLVQRTVFDIPMGLFVGSSILSTVFSIDPYTSFWGYYSRFNGGLASVLAYTAIFYVAASTLKRKHLPALLITLVLSLFGSSLYAFPEHFGYSPSCTLIRGEFSVDCWKQDVQQRVFGTFGQPNWLAAYIVTLLPLAVILPVISKKVPIQVLAVGTILLSYPTLLFTKSRSGFLGFAISMVFLAISLLLIFFRLYSTKIPRSPQPQKLRKFLYLVAVCGFLLFSSLLFGTPYSPSFSQILQKVQTEQTTNESSQAPEEQAVNRLEVGGTDSGEIRMIVWKGAIDIWRRYPLIGSGVETFAYSYYLDRPVAHNHVSEWDFLYNKAHNEFLNLLATTGVIGLFSYVFLIGWFCIASLVVATKRLKNIATAPSLNTQTSQDLFLLVALVVGVIALSISNFLGFATVAVSVALYLFFVIAQLIFSTQGENEETTQETVPSFSLWQKLGVGIILVTVLLFLLGMSNRWRADWYYNQGLQAARQSYIQESIPLFIKAIQLQPREAVFYDELANSYSKIAFVLAQQDIQNIEDAEESTEDTEETNESDAQSEASLYEQLNPQTQQFVQMAVTASDTALTLNAAHLNFYKTRLRVMLLFRELDQVFLDEAERTTQLAMRLSPTDPKLILSMAEIKLMQDDANAAIELLEKSVALKPNYETARMALAELYTKTEEYQAALEQYGYVLSNLSPENEIALQAVVELKEIDN
jgi:putative inorganic carbon (hco3(-)) transporter